MLRRRIAQTIREGRHVRVGGSRESMVPSSTPMVTQQQWLMGPRLW